MGLPHIYNSALFPEVVNFPFFPPSTSLIQTPPFPQIPTPDRKSHAASQMKADKTVYKAKALLLLSFLSYTGFAVLLDLHSP